MSDHCEQRFLTSGSSVNRRESQNEKKPFECDLCEKRYNRPDHLAAHKRTQTGDKPYECKVCKKRFTDSGTIVPSKLRNDRFFRRFVSDSFVNCKGHICVPRDYNSLQAACEKLQVSV